jgi:hypothetical protein
MTTTNDPVEIQLASLLAALEPRPARMGMLRAAPSARRRGDAIDAEPREPTRDTRPMRMTMLRRPVE